MENIELQPPAIKYTKQNRKRVMALSKRLLNLMEALDDENLYLFGGTWGMHIVHGDDDCILSTVGGPAFRTSGGCGAISHKYSNPDVACLEGSER